MLILGIETSCDETSASVLQVASGRMRFLSNAVFSQIKLHAITSGVVPEVAAREHIKKIIPVIDRALKKSRISLPQIELIAVTAGPGLLTSLLVGVDTAKALSFALNIPIIAINHIESHIFSPFIKPLSANYLPRRQAGKLPTTNSCFPAISLVVSGGHTELFLVKNWLDYKKLGGTVDDAAGECFDKTAKLLNLPYPGGPSLSKLAKRGKPTIDFPRPMLNSGNFDFSFSGLKTAVLYYMRDHKRTVDSGQWTKNKTLYATRSALYANIAASAQAAIVDVLVAKTIRAAAKFRAKTVLLGGGVAANQALRAKLKVESKKLKVKLLVARPEFCTDNAAMIAFAGYLHARNKNFTPLKKVIADSNWEL